MKQKKWMSCRLLAGGLVTLSLTAAAMAASQGSQSDPLVTLSYLNDKAVPAILSQVDTKIAQRETDLKSQLQQVADGYAVFSPKLAGFVLNALGPGSPSASPDLSGGTQNASSQASHNDDPFRDDIDIDVLSPREQEVMRLIARGYSYKEVAAELFISIKTVETHVSKVLRKLQLSNRGELARWAAYRRIV